MPSTTKLDGLTPEAAIDVIKQKHWSDLTAEDFAFLKARESYLSEADKAIYLEGADPIEVAQDSGNALTANERIINENRPLQENERRIRAARDAAAAAELAATVSLSPEAKTEADEKLAEDRANHIDTISEEAAQIEKDAKATAKKAEADAKNPKKTGAVKEVVVKGEEVA